MAGRRRRGRGESPLVRGLQERERHVAQVAAYGFFPGRGPRRSATVTPAPLRYWQFVPPRPWLVLAAVVLVAGWLALFGWIAGAAAVADEVPVAVALGTAVLVLSTGRLTVSDSGLSFDVAGLRRTSPVQVVPRSLVLEVRRGGAAEGWPRPRRRGGWWPGRTRVAVRHLALDGGGADGTTERSFTVRVRNAEAFAAALGQRLSG